MRVEIYERKPEGFSLEMEVAVCYLEWEGALLMLKQPPEKSEPGTWGLPGGKFEPGEAGAVCARRELFEETGILIDSAKILFLETLYIRKPRWSFAYHMFQVLLQEKPPVCLSDEHEEYLWADSEKRKTIPLIAGTVETIQRYERLKMPS
jgi:8-oxo-dGTP diphosphatase